MKKEPEDSILKLLPKTREEFKASIKEAIDKDRAFLKTLEARPKKSPSNQNKKVTHVHIGELRKSLQKEIKGLEKFLESLSKK